MLLKNLCHLVCRSPSRYWPIIPQKKKVGRCCISLCMKSFCCLKICLRQPFVTPTAKHTLSLLCSYFSLYFQLLWMAISLCQLLHAPESFPKLLFLLYLFTAAQYLEGFFPICVQNPENSPSKLSIYTISHKSSR